MKTQKQTARSIDRAAADWVARLDARTPTAEERAALDAWLAGDPRCLGAFARARALHVSEDIAEAVASPRPGAPAPLTRRGFLAAAAAGAAGAALFLAREEDGPARDYASEIGEIRTIPLEDGSKVTLNTESRIRVEYRAHERLVRLLRGEAYFEVARNPRRPFVVLGSPVQARAVGTAYSVRLGDEPGHMEICVTEGRVAVEPPPSVLAQAFRLSASPSSGAYLDADQMAEVRIVGDGPDKGEIQVSIRDATPDMFERDLMWRQGLLSFEGQTLAEAIAEFARYSRRRIALRGGAAQERVSGLFSATDPAGFARAIAISLKLKLRTENGTIVLYK